MMFDFLRPVASANLTTDFSGSGHSSIRRFASSFSSHLTRLFLTAGILMTGAFSSHFQSRSAARRMAEMEKELSEAKQAVILNAPRHQKLKEMSEGIVSMFRVDPDLAGPLMAMVTTMLGAI